MISHKTPAHDNCPRSSVNSQLRWCLTPGLDITLGKVLQGICKNKLYVMSELVTAATLLYKRRRRSSFFLHQVRFSRWMKSSPNSLDRLCFCYIPKCLHLSVVFFAWLNLQAMGESHSVVGTTFHQAAQKCWFKLSYWNPVARWSLEFFLFFFEFFSPFFFWRNTVNPEFFVRTKFSYPGL